MKFFKDIQNFEYTRKFWAGLLEAVIITILTVLSEYQEFAPIVALLGALGVYVVPNAKK